MQKFDSYFSLLGIPPAEQPPNCYRLLGLAPFASDVRLIIDSANQVLRHLNAFSHGPFAPHAQALMHEVEMARQLLSNPHHKSHYDLQLRGRLTSQAVPAVGPFDETPAASGILSPRGGRSPQPIVEPIPVVLEIAQAAEEAFAADPLAGQFAITGPRTAKRASGGIGATSLNLLQIVAGGGGGLALGIIFIWYVLGSDPFGLFGSNPVAIITPTPPEITPPEIVPVETSPAKPPDPPPVVKQPPPAPPTVVTPPDIKPRPTPPAETPASQNPKSPRNTAAFITTQCEINERVKMLGPCAESFAVPSLIAGLFLGNGEWFDIDVAEEKGVPHWRLRVNGVRDVTAAATEFRSPYRGLFQNQVEFKEWKRGDPPLKLIHRQDGLAVLSGVTGCFLGPELVQLKLEADGFWYLSGSTAHDSRARAAIYRAKTPGKLQLIVKEYSLTPGTKATTVGIGALCSLTQVTGRFQGRGEALHCAPDEATWRLWCDSQQVSTRGTAVAISLGGFDIVDSAPPAVAADPPAQAKIPTAAETAAVQEQLAKTIVGRSVAELLTQAQTASNNERYVLLRAARDQAAAEGQCATAMNCSRQLAAAFALDDLELAGETLQKLRAGCQTPEANLQLATLALAHFERAKAAAKTAELRPAAELALAAARAAQDNELQRRATLKLLEK